MLEENPAENTGLEVVAGEFRDEAVRFVARRLIVQLAEGAAGEEVAGEEGVAARVSAALAALPEGTTVIRGPSATGRLVVLLPEAESAADTVLANVGVAETTSAIEYVEPDVVDRAQIVPNDPRFAQQWGPTAVGAEAAWDLETGAGNVLIGIIDSGISMSADVLDHDDLRDAARITLGTDFVDGGTPRDLNGHGTHVAGIAAAAGNNATGVAGMNWGSPVYICRTLDASGNGGSADFADAVEEITDYAVARGLKAVINYSGGGPANNTKQQACQYASDRGMLVIAAAGNDNGGPVIWPAAYSTSIPGVVAVGSTDPGDVISSFSNIGPEVTVVAPGRNILSTLPTYSVSPTLPLNYGSLSGTSMATPLVTGLAALMWSRHPGHTNAKIKQCLQDSAVKLGAAAFDNSWGHGRVDARAALTCGDLIIPVTRIGPCRSRIVLCEPSTLTICRTFLQVNCPSRLPILCQTTRLGTGCVSGLRCPSVVDGCQSSLGCRSELCDPNIPVRPPVDPVLHEIVGRLEELERRVSGESSASQGDWFYVDDDGEVHEV
ncbi:S8 family serine peptidase [Acrocarpospora sp. B8E8]|uniref:S8 family serine peptidase n=1 Tax=Acrocarpospora sp. B8E8 TaxID=3153572 RepID=UPI00325E438C